MSHSTTTSTDEADAARIQAHLRRIFAEEIEHIDDELERNTLLMTGAVDRRHDLLTRRARLVKGYVMEGGDQRDVAPLKEKAIA